MKKRFCFLLSIIMLSIIFVKPISAASFYVSCYEEAIYAGGIVDLYAYPSTGDTEDYTYQWQYDAGFGDGHWYNITENDNYSGTKTNHLRMKTSTGSYDSWEEIPFQCVVTASDGTVRYSPNLYMYIYPTEKLIPNMKSWGYGLFTPNVTNVTDFSTSDDVNYTASTYAGSNLKIFCGSKSIDDKPVLRKSEVGLTTEIHITENGHTTISGNNTSYIPYTVGRIQIQIKEKLTIGQFDLGYFDTKNISIKVEKPNAIATGTTKSDCSLLRYTYNESQKLASIPKGTTFDIVGTEGSYYQVYYNGYVGYVGKSLVNSSTESNDKLITNIDMSITQPVAGKTPASTCTINTVGCKLYHTDPVTWTDSSTGKLLKSTDKFVEGKRYSVSIWVSAESGYHFQTDATNKPKLTGSINGNLPPFINKAYEQDPTKVVELTYTFGSTPKAPESTEPSKPVEPSKPIEPSKPTDPVHAHTPSDWRTTGIYHYKVCITCGDMLEQEDHRWSPTDQTCKDCGYIIEPNKNHEHNLKKVSKTPATCMNEGNIEYYFCTGCNDRFTDSAAKNKISETMSVMLDALGHSVSEEWYYDTQYHWSICRVCNDVLDETRMFHEVENEKCMTCGYAVDSGEIKETPDSEKIVKSDSEEKPVEETSQNEQCPQPQEKSRFTLYDKIMIGISIVSVAVTVTMIVLKKFKQY